MVFLRYKQFIMLQRQQQYLAKFYPMTTLKLICQNSYKKLNPLPVTTITFLLRYDKLNRLFMTQLMNLSGMLFTALLIETSPTSHSLRDRLYRTCMSPPMALTGTTAPPLLKPTGVLMILLLILVQRDGMEFSA
jgi:hypothetical protein